MHLRRVEAQGFKSFADRQRFDFGPGMTAVVGPNGSGKSNVSDAIRWALGEQSTRLIRARKTEDVIFSGSDKRRAMGLAEVTITLDNTEGWMPIEFSEVTVTRRAYRSGENEYLINGTKVRLLDVQALFRRAQVGQNSYAMMSQGLVDEVLALRPVERRDLIEEAADVHRHRLELQRSERRLTETRDNLGHVRMLIREVEPRLRQLERQTTRAERYRVLHAEISEALQVYYEHELRAAGEALTAARARHDQHTQAFTSARTQLDAIVTRLAIVDAAATERRTVLDHAQAEERVRAEEGLRLQQAVALAEQRLELLGIRAAEVQTELAAAPPVADAAQEPAEDAALDARVAAATTAVEREREALRSADEAARTLLRSLADAEARRTRIESELRDAERRIAEHAAAVERQSVAHAAAARSREAAQLRLRDYGKRALEMHGASVQFGMAAQDARRRREVAERQLEEQLRLAVEANDALRQATTTAEALEQRQSMLEQLTAQAADAGNGAQALVAASTQHSEDGAPLVPGVIGVLSRLLRVPEGLERAIEAALAEQLSAVVVEHTQDAIAAVEYLREQQSGAATVFPLDGMAHNSPLNLFNERGVVGVAARLVRVEQRYRPLIDTLLGRTIIVDNLEVAQRMLSRGLGAIVTRDGVLLQPGGAVYGGQGTGGAEQLGLLRELDAFPERVAEARAAEEIARAKFDRAEPAVLDAREAVTQSRRAVDEAEDRRRRHDQARSNLRRELVALGGELRVAHAALAVRVAPAPAANEAGEALADRPAALQLAIAALADEITTLRERSEAIGTERDATAERVTSEATALASAEGEREARRTRRAQRAEEQRLAAERLEQRQALLAQVRRESEDIALSLRDLRERLANNRTALTAAEEAVAPAHALLADILGEQRELGAQRGDTQSRLFSAERDMLAGEAALRLAAQQLQSLQQQIVDEGLAVQPDGSVRIAPPADASPADGVEGGEAAAADGTSEPVGVGAPAAGGAEIDPEALRQRITVLRGEIRALGPVNIDALQDLSEERERHGFLTAQVGDLEAAEVELRSAIKDLEELIRTRFEATFALVNQNFGEYFRRFFGGGVAELKIVDAEDSNGDAGVEITAQPPGKRVSSINMLSGGERSLTSVALLFALLQVNPAPVVVMDEVDAALDEANVGRFVETLQELTERSQFIVITHNRRTVEAADTIYGVSMGEESTSQVLSLSLSDLPRTA